MTRCFSFKFYHHLSANPYKTIVYSKEYSSIRFYSRIARKRQPKKKISHHNALPTVNPQLQSFNAQLLDKNSHSENETDYDYAQKLEDWRNKNEDQTKDTKNNNQQLKDWQSMINQASKKSDFQSLQNVWHEIFHSYTTSALIHSSNDSQLSENSSNIHSRIEILTYLMNAFGKVNDCQSMLEIFQFIIEYELPLDNILITTLLSNLADNQMFSEAKEIFHYYISQFEDETKMEENVAPMDKKMPDLIVFNSALKVFAKDGNLTRNLYLIELMRNKFNIEADAISYSTLINTCKNALPIPLISDALHIFESTAKLKKIDVYHFCNLINVYNELSNIYLKYYSKKQNGHPFGIEIKEENKNEEIMKKFEYHPEYNQKKVIQLFYEMIREYRIEANSYIFSSVFNSCAMANDYETCVDIYQYMVNYCGNTVRLSNVLLASIIKCAAHSINDGNKFQIGKELYLDFYGSQIQQTLNSDKISAMAMIENIDMRFVDGGGGQKFSRHGILWSKNANIFMKYFQRQDRYPNIHVFNALLNCFISDGNLKKGVNDENIHWIQTQLQIFNILPNSFFYLQLLQIANEANEKLEVQRIAQLVLKRMVKLMDEKNESTVAKNYRRSLNVFLEQLKSNENILNKDFLQDLQLYESIIDLLVEYNFVQNAVQFYDFLYREMQIVKHWSMNENEIENKNKRMSKRNLRKQKKKESENIEQILDLKKYCTASSVCICLKYVLENEWRDLSKDLHVLLTDDESLQESVLDFLRNEFGISVSIINQQQSSLLILKADQIKKWIFQQIQTQNKQAVVVNN